MTHTLVDSLGEADENIRRCQTEIQKDPQVAERMRHVRAWYAVKSDDGMSWLFGPSRFVGYAKLTAEAYLSMTDGRHGKAAVAVLKEWFDVVPLTSPLGAEVAGALLRFLKSCGHSGLRKNAWICVRRGILAGGADAVSPGVQNRIHLDPAICGGRPHIRGTRVRVSDILDLLTSGASMSDILADYPYLSEADLRAALAYGAAATAHRIILAA